MCAWWHAHLINRVIGPRVCWPVFWPASDVISRGLRPLWTHCSSFWAKKRNRLHPPEHPIFSSQRRFFHCIYFFCPLYPLWTLRLLSPQGFFTTTVDAVLESQTNDCVQILCAFFVALSARLAMKKKCPHLCCRSHAKCLPQKRVGEWDARCSHCFS